MYGESDISTNPTDFSIRKYFIAFALEEVGHQSASQGGLSTKNQNIITTDFKNSGLGTSGDYCLIYLVFKNTFTLRDRTVNVYD